MPTFSRFIAENLSFLTFAAGFLVFCGSIAWWSVPVAGVAGGSILMALAVYPYVVRKS